jgi:hypothetical protein
MGQELKHRKKNGFWIKTLIKKGLKTETSTIIGIKVWKNLLKGKRKPWKSVKKKIGGKWKNESTVILEGSLNGLRSDYKCYHSEVHGALFHGSRASLNHDELTCRWIFVDLSKLCIT